MQYTPVFLNLLSSSVADPTSLHQATMTICNKLKPIMLAEATCHHLISLNKWNALAAWSIFNILLSDSYNHLLFTSGGLHYMHLTSYIISTFSQSLILRTNPFAEMPSFEVASTSSLRITTLDNTCDEEPNLARFDYLTVQTAVAMLWCLQCFCAHQWMPTER